MFKKMMKKLMYRSIQNHRVSIQSENDRLSFHFTGLKPFIGQKFFVIKDRSTGRRLKKEIKHNQADFNYEDILSLADSTVLDFYVKAKLYNRYLSKRTPFSKTNYGFSKINKDSNFKISSYKTKDNYLSFNTKRVLFFHKIKHLKTVGKNFYIEGQIESVKPAQEINKLELIMVRRDNKKAYGFNLDFYCNEDIYFKDIILIDKLKNDLNVNSRWDLFLQIRDGLNKVIYKELIEMNGYDNFDHEEDRYLLVNPDTNGMQSVLYATMGKESLALWYTDKPQFEKTYAIAKGKTVFNETCERHPLNRRMVFFESFLGKSYSGNPKYIYEEMLKMGYGDKFTFVWSYSGEEKIPGEPIIVQRESEEYYKYLALSKYWVSNIIFPVHRKREGNIYLQTWHGTPLKKLGYDIEVDGPEKMARENFYLESRNWDYLLSANQYSSGIFRRAFKFNKKMLEFGYPANDIFYKRDASIIKQQIKEKIGIPKDKKVILYAPTWRDNQAASSWNHVFDLKIDLNQFKEQLSDEYVLVLRMHHLISESLNISEELASSVYDLSSYDDIQELYLISDILITDYSSVFFEFANTGRPMLFYAYDFDMYKNQIRGFYLDMEKDLPGPILKTNEELISAIKDIDEVQRKFEDQYQDFVGAYCYLEKGDSSAKVIREVFEGGK
ncbi:CDP-glycerol glycerophosphotransferase family protein [Bacillus glycinifermentans]|uniref:CDP-glycerol glycerophosphotransferase n=2 Tax=Bacillus glycinifermentans TaxID=1664069 RepID=A0A0T6BKF6_9BACI|nr:CDP-glycerol glycerophosphotransferase family protein [Bacillus glycinifermentans]ATH93464.1 CDP-glycerol glycerophosphotransferase family protein [Bacillus glycinifermentans]KRT90369.1 CDP-glycerol glycerophosphotransferase [Bacillus glycinifermentans]MEC0484068.1 CDP-glycerol glycerophosphotransferase family protein [Bacillus glycinifermentans]MEC3607838.1 CDP-glycerol glycerophosphotransferase family protein [Bacillus glycinifermentans]UOY86972.1 CDP-glycerol glycerophosphotransferase fa